MSEENPNGQWDNSELKELIRELELQIEGVNAGLGKIRGTVARIAYASLGTATPSSASSWGTGLGVAPANRTWPAATSLEAPPSEPASSPPSPSYAVEAPQPLAPPPPEHEAPPGFWDSVAEGASWPRALSDTPVTEPVPDAPSKQDDAPRDDFAWAGFGGQATPDAVDTAQPEANVPELVGPPSVEAGVEWREPAVEAVMQPLTPAEEALPEPEVETAAQAWILEPAQPEPASQPEKAAPEPASWYSPEAPKADAEPPAAPPVGGLMPSTLSSGWPDESAWSQSFEWPAMRPEEAQRIRASESRTEGSPAGVSDIVAQVKAELEAARAQGVDLPIDEEPGSPASDTPAQPEMDDEARREEVSRAVADMRQQLQSGALEDAIRGQSPDSARAPVEPHPEENRREEVRRAVEAAREELSTGFGEAPSRGEKPAFRLAAPGSIPDWSHIQMEPSGPPVVVMKDADGRVELASVYETLNELGCGDGAALLNYTPHSVTVGLPIAAAVPSKERVAEAVEKVFGLSSRVESDGVRITVSIGVDPKRRSVDAA